LREFLDAILDFISADSLTDEEFDDIEALDLEQAYSKEIYAALLVTLEERENVSDQIEKLKLYFIARGLDLDVASSPQAQSNIFLGGTL